MKRIDFTIEKYGFYGSYFQCNNKTNSVLLPALVMIVRII